MNSVRFSWFPYLVFLNYVRPRYKGGIYLMEKAAHCWIFQLNIWKYLVIFHGNHYLFISAKWLSTDLKTATKGLDYFMCMSVLPGCVSVRHFCVWCLWRPEECIRSPGTGVTLTVSLLGEIWKWNLVLCKSSGVLQYWAICPAIFLASLPSRL